MCSNLNFCMPVAEVRLLLNRASQLKPKMAHESSSQSAPCCMPHVKDLHPSRDFPLKDVLKDFQNSWHEDWQRDLVPGPNEVILIEILNNVTLILIHSQLYSNSNSNSIMKAILMLIHSYSFKSSCWKIHISCGSTPWKEHKYLQGLPVRI